MNLHCGPLGRLTTRPVLSGEIPDGDHEIVEELHYEGETTRNGEFEIGVDFSSETMVQNLKASTWFLPRELAPVNTIQRRSKEGPFWPFSQ
jgi:hypothetical protein